jgi:hypothetical protein
MIEFVLYGIPALLLIISTVQIAISMWQFHTIEEAVQVAGRYVSTHGRGCSQNSNSCTTTVGVITRLVKTNAPGVDPSVLNLTLSSFSNTIACNPLSTCLSSITQFPSSTDNGVNSDINISATYAFANPLLMLWPGSAPVAIGGYTLGASTTQRILF